MDNLTKKLYILSDCNQTYQELINEQDLPNLIITTIRSEAEILLAAPPLLATQLDDFPNVKWVQSLYAGVDALMNSSLRRDYLLTNVKGIFGQQISEYVLGLSIQHLRHFATYRDQQASKQWQAHPYRSLSECTMVIVGTGSIGSHLARTAKAFGIHTIGVNRSGIPPINSVFDQTFHVHELNHAISQADILVNTLPHTQETVGIINEDALANSKNILLFNVGRGQAIDQSALINALNSGLITHAYLDVFDQEPLSEQHPFWTHSKISITPHVAALSFPHQVVAIFTNHYRDWHQGFALKDHIDFTKGY